MRNIGITGLWVAALSLAFGCASKSNGGDSETNWVACKTTADCHGGQTCEAERCVDPSTLGDGGSVPTNPTGNCKPPEGDNGARAGYHAPAKGDVWLPDCKNVLQREYFRVFATSPKTAYVMPRPDGAETLSAPCTSTAHPLRALVDKYSLCSSATDPAVVDRMNSMDPAEALALTHFMHTQLVFTHVPNAVVAPFGIPSDLLDACALHPATNSPTLAGTCADAQTALQTGPEPFTGANFFESADEIVRLLNELYGIGDCGNGTIPARTCLQCGPAGGCAELGIACTTLCSAAADCTTSPGGPECFSGVCVQNPPCD